MPCKTTEERQTRDRKAFLLHSLFIDVSVFKAVAAIKNLVENNKHSTTGSSSIKYEEKLGDLFIGVTKDVADASMKLDCKTDGSRVLGMSQEEITKRNLLKGITADESATVHVSLAIRSVLHFLKFFQMSFLFLTFSEEKKYIFIIHTYCFLAGYFYPGCCGC